MCDLPARLTSDDASSVGGRLLRSVREGSWPVRALWLDFVGYRGSFDYWEFDGYVNGLWTMPLADRLVLAQVVWEREHDLCD